MELVEARLYSNIQIEYDRGSILNGSTYIIPVGRSPLPIKDSASVISGWPLYFTYNNIPYESRYNLDVSMLLEDMTYGDCSIERLPTTNIGNRHTFYSLGYNLRVSNLILSWNLFIPEATITIDDETISGRFGDDKLPSTYGYLTLDLGSNLTNPNDAGISNHYIVKYGALDRGYGRAKHGWFYADVAGLWSFSVDGNDACEISIDDGVVASKYTNSGLSGKGILNGEIDLSIGWHHLFAYTSDRSNSAYPSIWFRRPGDSSWQDITQDQSDGLIWSNSRIVPNNIKFSSNAGNITAIIHYDDTNELALTFDQTKLHSGNIKVDLDSLPRYKHYYWFDWRESNRSDRSFPISIPPYFNGIRMIMEYVPRAEVLFFPEYTMINYTPKFLVRPRIEGIDWYSWDGTNFVQRTVTSIADLDNAGNTIFDINNISESDWLNFTGNDDYVVELMFTKEPPLTMASNRKLLGNPTEAEFMLSVKNRIQGNVRVEKREI